jgi:hypothetical protein
MHLSCPAYTPPCAAFDSSWFHPSNIWWVQIIKFLITKNFWSPGTPSLLDSICNKLTARCKGIPIGSDLNRNTNVTGIIRHPAGNAHAPYCRLWHLQLFLHYLNNGTIFFKKILLNVICVFWFSLQLLSETFLILKEMSEIWWKM